MVGRSRCAGAVVVVFVAIAASAANAQGVPRTTVDDVSVTQTGSTLTVSGHAVFADASTAVVGVDPTGDSGLAGAGLDLTEASIGYSPDTRELTFRAKVADALVEPLFTLPEATHYLWHIQVTHGNDFKVYQLMAMRSGQYNRTVPYPDYLFRVNGCGKTASGEPSCFTVAGTVPGSMANGVIQWKVPAALIGAYPGAVIAQPQARGVYGVETALGATGFTYAREGDVGDLLTPQPYIVDRSVGVGLRAASAPPDSLQFSTVASVGPDGTFAAKLASPTAPGEYVVGTRACHGVHDSCGFGQSTVTVP